MDFKNGDLYIPNKKWKSQISNNFDPTSSCFIIEILSKKEINEEIQLFKQAFEKEIEEIKNNYESYEIKFGVINWIS